MSEIEKQQDNIDEYIRGTMSDNDRVIFEGKMRQDADLMHEVEVQASIAEAVQAVRLKQLFQEIETGRAGESQSSEGIAAAADRIHPFVFWRLLKWTSVAASVVLLFFVGISFHRQQWIKEFGYEYYASIERPVPRGEDELERLLSSCYSLIGTEEYVEAMADLKKARQLIDEGFKEPVVDEETEYEHKLLQKALFDAEWYDALILMRQGKYRKAKDALLLIVDSESPYADHANDILERMFHIKH